MLLLKSFSHMTLDLLVKSLAAAGCIAALAAATACGSDGSGGVLTVDAGGDGAAATGGGGSAGTGGAGGSAATGGAGGCTATSDCPTAQVCDRANNSCVQCLIDGDCVVGARCISNVCQTPSTCSNSLDCAGGQNPVCDALTGQCVQCVIPNDCPDNNDCISHTCAPYVPCVNSLDCPTRQVCDANIGRCVECLSALDCGATQTCVGGACRPICESDNHCTPLGLLCSPNIGYCVECLRDEDCVASRWCSSGVCASDVCTPGAKRCQNNAVQTCNDAGSGWTDAACSAYQTCKETTTGPACQNWICTPSTIQCDTTTERVMQCSADGLAQAVIQDCGTQVCVAAACKPVLCSAGTRRCAGNLVYQCSAKGDAETVYDTCATAEYCDGTTKTCLTMVCTPNNPACDGNVATTCNSIGSGYTGTRTTCTGSTPYCANGVCTVQLCVPNSRFCDNGVVRQCSADGLSATLYQTCTTSQYCDDATATCKAKICTPDAPACNGNSTTTCNSLGSGYTSAGTPCGSLYCVSGVCQTALFAEDWEDGDYNGWTVPTGTYSVKAVQNTFAANGTTWSLQLTGGTGTESTGLLRVFTTPLSPTRVSWWARAAQTTIPAAYFMMYPSSTSTDYIAWMYFNDTGSISCRGSGSAILRPYVANQWYHIEFRNINWTSRTFDYYIDDVLVQASVGMSGSGTAVGKLNLQNWTGSGTAYWDQIEFQ